jgi:hypothetical protein
MLLSDFAYGVGVGRQGGISVGVDVSARRVGVLRVCGVRVCVFASGGSALGVFFVAVRLQETSRMLSRKKAKVFRTVSSAFGY